jgi:hypothetical protein
MHHSNLGFLVYTEKSMHLVCMNNINLQMCSDYYLLLFAKMFTPEYCDSFFRNPLKYFVKHPLNKKYLRNADNFIFPTHKTVFFTSCVKYSMEKLCNDLSVATKQARYN